MTERVVYVNPPSKCDTCSEPIGNEFSDAYLPRYRTWGNVCPSCAVLYRVTYGTGKGQRYQRQANGEFVKVSGSDLAKLQKEGQ